MTNNMIQWEKISGEPVNAHGYTVTPETRVLALRTRFGGFVWNRPVSLVVERGETRERVTIPDVTLTAQVLLTLGVMLASIFFLARRKGGTQ